MTFLGVISQCFKKQKAGGEAREVIGKTGEV